MYDTHSIVRRDCYPTRWDIITPAGRIVASTFTQYDAQIVKAALDASGKCPNCGERLTNGGKA